MQKTHVKDTDILLRQLLKELRDLRETVYDMQKIQAECLEDTATYKPSFVRSLKRTIANVQRGKVIKIAFPTSQTQTGGRRASASK